MDETFAIRYNDPLATNRLGEYAVTKVILRAMDKGFSGAFRPVWEGRVDLVLYDGLKLYRAQVKYAGGSCPKQCRGVVSVGLSKWRNGGRSITPYYTASEIDVLLVYVRKNDKILWFGPEVFEGRTKLFIRLEPSRNNQMKGCLMASDYIW